MGPGESLAQPLSFLLKIESLRVLAGAYPGRAGRRPLRQAGRLTLPNLDQGLYFADDSLRIEPVVRQQLLRFAGAWQIENSELVYLNSRRA
jgi:hypothetical protein